AGSGPAMTTLPNQRPAALLARGADRRYFHSFSACSLRLAAQDVALSRRKQGFESPRERQSTQILDRNRPSSVPCFSNFFSKFDLQVSAVIKSGEHQTTDLEVRGSNLFGRAT